MNKNISLSGFIILIIIMSVSCTSLRKIEGPRHLVTPFSDTVMLRGGTAVYALPRTVFTFNVEMERTIELPGPYASYAEELLGLKDVILSEGEYWYLEGISVSSHEEADPSEYYVIESSDIFHSNVLALKKEGLILDLNPAQAYPHISNLENGEITPEMLRSYDLGSDQYYGVLRDTAYRRVNLDTAFVRIPYVVESRRKLTTSQLAERTAKRLMEIRDGKILILTGEANVFPQDDAAINELNRLEKEYTELFAGKTITEKRTFTFQLIPSKEMSDNQLTLFRYSEVTGIQTSDSGNGKEVTVTLTPEKKTKAISYISSRPADPFNPPADRLFYRVPDVVNLSVKIDDEVIYTTRKMIYQFGEIIQLPGNYIMGK